MQVAEPKAHQLSSPTAHRQEVDGACRRHSNRRRHWRQRVGRKGQVQVSICCFRGAQLQRSLAHYRYHLFGYQRVSCAVLGRGAHLKSIAFASATANALASSVCRQHCFLLQLLCIHVAFASPQRHKLYRLFHFCSRQWRQLAILH